MQDFVNELRSMQGDAACSAELERPAFGWIKTITGQDKTKFRGCDRVGWAFIFAAAAYDLVRLLKLTAASP